MATRGTFGPLESPAAPAQRTLGFPVLASMKHANSGLAPNFFLLRLSRLLFFFSKGFYLSEKTQEAEVNPPKDGKERRPSRLYLKLRRIGHPATSCAARVPLRAPCTFPPQSSPRAFWLSGPWRKCPDC